MRAGRIDDEETRSQVLRLLRESSHPFLSGQELSRQLGISRAAIWKQIEQLRNLGYDIVAIPARGYHLQAGPERLTPAELRQGLQTALVGRDIHCFSSIPSTNSHACQLAEGGATEGTVVVADAQSAGKGRLGRSWASPPGVNLYLSLILRPPVPPREAPLMTFLSSLAVARTIEDVTGLVPTVKWPNDVLLNGRKVAGLLNEMSAESERIHYVVLGIGLNINMRADEFPADLRYPATSLLLATGSLQSRLALCRRLFAELDELYRDYLANGHEGIMNGWLRYFDLLNVMVEVFDGHGSQRGRVSGVADDGALLLLGDDGAIRRILAGDVRPVPAVDPT